MARGRMLATTIADDKRFNALPVDAALVYLMAIPQLDRDGLILGEPVLLWGQVCRRRNDLMPHMADIIAAWVSSDWSRRIRQTMMIRFCTLLGSKRTRQ